MLNQVWKHLLPAMCDHPLPLDEYSYGTLVRTAESLAYSPIDSQVNGSIAEKVSGNRYVMDENKVMIHAMEWHFEGDSCLVKAWIQQSELQVRCGRGKWLEGMALISNEPQRILASGGWKSTDTYVMSWKMVETAFSEVYTCVFTQDRVKIARVESVRTNEAIVIEGKLVR